MFMFKRLLQSFKQLLARLAELPQRLLRLIQRVRRRSGQPQGGQAGFVLPTVTMVILVVILTSTTLVFRSIDRAKNASNFRVNQVVMNAAAPAIERAKAKMDAVFADPTLPRGGTPADSLISNVFNKERYDLDDEVRLQVAFDYGDANGNLGADGTIQTETNERVTTAWRFPVDTDNNGRYDSFTLYGVYYFSNTSRARQPSEARTRPQVLNAQNSTCEAATGTSASLVGNRGWFDQEGVRKKAFYVYVANVPITAIDNSVLFPSGVTIPAPYNDPGRYEVFQGNRGFTAMEYQQDRARIPLGNNAIVYEDDLDLSSGTTFRINGRIVTNSNLFASEPQNEDVRLYQVSSDESCFYEEENAKIVVGGNMSAGRLQDNEASGTTIQVDLFRGRGVNVGGGDNQDDGISSKTRSTRQTSPEVAYNNKAYEARIAYLVERVIADHGTQGSAAAYKSSNQDPSTVKDAVNARITNDPALESELNRLRSEELELWFRNRTRRVPSREVAFGQSETLTGVPYQEYGTDNLRPIDVWIYPEQTNVQLEYRRQQLPALNPQTRGNVEELLGDRVEVGNNLPALWWNDTRNSFATEDTENKIAYDSSIKWWTVAGGANSDPEERYRKTQTQRLDVPGATSRNGFWETNATTVPEEKTDAKGGLRVVTGAGIYLPAELRAVDDPLANRAGGRPRAEYVVWPDTMPQPPNPTLNIAVANADNHPYRNKIVERYSTTTGLPIYIDDETATGADAPVRPYLKMRASVVYHYSYPDDPVDNNPSNDTAGKVPIACVSNFYDPTDWKTAQNWSNLPRLAGDRSISGQLANGTEDRPSGEQLARVDGFSNNGVTYPPRRDSYSVNFNDSQLRYQANLVYPNGRPVNAALKKALDKGNQNDLTLADRAAIDAAYCGIDILINEGTGANETPIGGFTLVNGAIQEIAFLDGRQIKSVEKAKRNGDAQYQHSYTLQRLTDGQSDFQNNSEPQYDLEVEQRLPMEIRATVIDLKRLRRGSNNNNDPALRVPDPSAVQTGFPDKEYMFPMSGIIYATRDDALPDASDRPTDPEALTGQTLSSDPVTALVENEPNERVPADKVSATDYWLDPTRRPNGILLINGRELNRDPNNRFLAEEDDDKLTTEKGLTLASNLPVYIKGERADSGNANDRPGFNVHERPDKQVVEEFTQLLAADWSNFYNRTEAQLDKQFACRNNDERLADCTQGDKWRVANVLSDAMTLLSERYRFGFRNEGDYDIRNNQSDNLFRDSKVLLTGGANLRLHEAFPFDSKGLLAADFQMKSEYETLFPAAPFNDANYKHINGLRKDDGFNHASLGVNGLSSNPTVSNDAFVSSWLRRDGASHNRAAGDLRDEKYSEQNNVGFTNIVLNSSYFNNLISPVQRRVDNRYEYLMESCQKLPVSQCDPAQDWVIDSSGNNASNQLDSTAPTLVTSTDSGSTAIAPSPNFQRFPRRVAFLRYTSDIDLDTLHGSSRDKSYYENNEGYLILDNLNFPIPIAIDETTQEVFCNTYDSGDISSSVPAASSGTSLTFQYLSTGNRVECKPFSVKEPRNNQPNVLWYAPATSDTDAGIVTNKSDYRDNNTPIGLQGWNTGNPNTLRHPQLVPVMQINSAVRTDNVNVSGSANQPYNNTNWLPQVSDYGNNIHFNLIMATGDAPPRSNGTDGESNGGVANLPRFLENWTPSSQEETAEIKGSFIQLQRSAYATGPFNSMYRLGYNYDTDASLYGYKQRYLTGNGRFNHYRPPGRQWGFDVGILSQSPDLFSQQFGLPPTEDPNEFYREVSRRDDWVRTLLCATPIQRNTNGEIDDNPIQNASSPVINTDQLPSGTFCRENTLNN
ncbi:MAG: hypothetical protein F6J87_05630 [Spirulina sp. SIO3F2]|nr:hypothetical protein [Spirulina sp. SIO3F2]